MNTVVPRPEVRASGAPRRMQPRCRGLHPSRLPPIKSGVAPQDEGNKDRDARMDKLCQTSRPAALRSAGKDVIQEHAEFADGFLVLSGNVKLHASLLLQVADHAEEISCLRVTARAEHADKTLGRRIGRLGKLLEADCRLDVVAHDGLAGFKIAAEHCIDPFAQKGLSKYPVALDVAFDQIPEAFCLCHLRLRSAPSALALFVVPPIRVRFVDIALLLLLRAARQQDHQGLAICPK